MGITSYCNECGAETVRSILKHGDSCPILLGVTLETTRPQRCIHENCISCGVTATYHTDLSNPTNSMRDATQELLSNPIKEVVKAGVMFNDKVIKPGVSNPTEPFVCGWIQCSNAVPHTHELSEAPTHTENSVQHVDQKALEAMRSEKFNASGPDTESTNMRMDDPAVASITEPNRHGSIYEPTTAPKQISDFSPTEEAPLQELEEFLDGCYADRPENGYWLLHNHNLPDLENFIATQAKLEAIAELEKLHGQIYSTVHETKYDSAWECIKLIDRQITDLKRSIQSHE